jgi:hypothetical protein
MAKNSDFSQEELDRMYDKAMRWEPPTAAPVPQVDRQAVLERLLATKRTQSRAPAVGTTSNRFNDPSPR